MGGVSSTMSKPSRRKHRVTQRSDVAPVTHHVGLRAAIGTEGEKGCQGADRVAPRANVARRGTYTRWLAGTAYGLWRPSRVGHNPGIHICLVGHALRYLADKGLRGGHWEQSGA
jgi:hypothetical protein